MLKKGSRFTRASFPKGRPLSRRPFSWGTVSLYNTLPFVAVVVSKKTLKRAPDRNRAKRRVYGAVEDIALTKAVVVHLKREVLTANFDQIQKDLKSVLK